MLFRAKPILHVVVPGFKIFPFSMRESWRNLFRALDIPFEWVVHREGKAKKTMETLRRSKVVLLLNDHHLDELTESLVAAGEYGRGHDERLWLGLSSEKVQGSIFPRSVEKTELCSRLCHIVAHFDALAEPVIQRCGAISLFCHQYADTLTFRSDKAYGKKADQLFWVGKLKVGNEKGAYQERNNLFGVAKEIPGFAWREATNPEKKISYIVKERDSYKGLLNLPSNCPGYTASFFEHLAMGGCVIQYDVDGNPPRGLEPNIHFLSYQANDPDSLVKTIRDFLQEPSRFEGMARRGREACLLYHSLFRRAHELFEKAHQLYENRAVIEPNTLKLLQAIVQKLGDYQ
jgi:Glycosyl transferases group 1